MGYLDGLQAYLSQNYHRSAFDEALSSKTPLKLHLHGHRTLRATVIENLTYDIKVRTPEPGEEVIPKIEIKCLYPNDLSEAAGLDIKLDKKIEALDLEPLPAPKDRSHIKNKSLFPLMREKKVLFFTLREGEILRGIVTDFNRYEIILHMKGGLPITILRHGVYDLRDKQGRCYLKSFQETRKDWEKSPLFITEPADPS